jgi:CMP-N-acetylneuraminic acid synthetase
MISRQSRRDYEVVLVDNESSDKTVDKALQYGAKLVTIEKFLPGAAINRGIEASSGDIIVVLSGHCIPVNEDWLQNLVSELEDEQVAGVYGRQEPLAFTPDLDKRDLLITFGLDRREQFKDSFFHNANSAFRRSVWERFPFDEAVTNIEDRIWAHAVQAEGFKIIYEPSASVYHYHGIHQEADPERCGSIIKIVESIDPPNTGTSGNRIDPSHLNVVLVVPVREEGLRTLGDKQLYEYSIEHAKASKFVKTIAVSTNLDAVADKATGAGADIVLRRSNGQSRFDVILELMMQASLQDLEQQGIIPDVVVMLEPTFPFRDEKILDLLISQYAHGGFDTVIPARVEYNSCWMEDDGAFRRMDDGYISREFKTPFYTGLKGLCCVCSPATVRSGNLFGENVGLYKLDDVFPMLEVRTDSDAQIAEALLNNAITLAGSN